MILAVSLLAIQSMTYAADQDKVIEDPTTSLSTQTVVVKDDEPISQPKGDDAPTVIDEHTTVPTKKKKSSCFSCFGGSKEKD